MRKIFARDGDRDSERTKPRSDAHDIQAKSCAFFLSSSVIRSAYARKLPLQLRGVEKPNRAPFRARARKPFGLRKPKHRAVPGILMSSQTRQLLGNRAQIIKSSASRARSASIPNRSGVYRSSPNLVMVIRPCIL